MLVRFVEIDLAQALQPVCVDPRYQRLSILACWGRMPLGIVHLAVYPNQPTLTPGQLQAAILRELGWKLWELTLGGQLDALDRPDGAALPPISLVVCTRDRPLSLGRCLAALARLDYPVYEVVVVDNCSRSDAVRQAAAQSGFRYVREDTPGLDWARNRGVRESKYDIIAFIDDDALASPDWLRGVAHGFEDPHVMVVTGLVLPAEVETQAQSYFEWYGGMGKGLDSKTICRDALGEGQLFWSSGWGVGANMAFRRSLFGLVGDFDVALDVGTPANGGGDIEMFYRAVAAGHLLRYETAARVSHVHRRDAAALDRQIYNNGRAFRAYLLTIAHKQPGERGRLLRFTLRHWLWHWLLRRMLDSLIRRDKTVFRFALTELRGALTAPGAYRRSRRVAEETKSARMDAGPSPAAARS